MSRHARPSEHNSTYLRLQALAAPQGGHVTREQLHAAGFTRNAIAHLVRRGTLIRVHRGVYAVGHVPTQPLDRAHAALLAVGDRSALSHASAASFWGITGRWQFPLHVICPLRRSAAGVTIHHCVTLTRADVHVDPASGVRVTSAARTALDLAATMSDRRATRMVNDLRVRGVLGLAALLAVLERNPTHSGAVAVGTILRGSQREPTRSHLEEVYLALGRRAGLPEPEVNVLVAGHRVDFLYRAAGVIVEVDGYRAHSSRAQFAADRRRDREILLATGIITLRFTYADCVERPGEVAAQVAAALRRGLG